MEAFLAAYRALAGAPSGGISHRVRLSSVPSRWTFSGTLSTTEFFASSKLPKSTVSIDACIGWFWGDRFDKEAWEKPVAAANLVPLGAKQVEPWGIADQAWHVKALSKSSTPHVLKLSSYYALCRGPVAVVHEGIGREFVADLLEDAVKDHVTTRLHGPASMDLSAAANAALKDLNDSARLATYGIERFLHSAQPAPQYFPVN